MTKNIFLEGQKVYLRNLAKQDLSADYLQWLNDEEVCRFNSHAVFPNTEEKMQAYFNSLLNQQAVVLAIIYKETDTHIGNVSLQNINWISRNAEFAIMIGNKNYWKGGFGTEAATMIVEYGFTRLNLHRIYCGTIEGNEGMQKLSKVLKMKEEGLRREAIFKNGKFLHILEYGVLQTEFFELK